MDRSPSPPPPPAPQVQPEAKPSPLFMFADPETFMEMARRFISQTAPTNAAAGAAAQPGGVVPTSSSVPVQQRLPLLGSASTAPGPRAAGLVPQLTMSLRLSSDNPGPCVLNKAPDPLLLEASDSEEEANEVEMEDAEEAEAIREGRFYLLPSPPPGRNAGEPELLILFPLEPSSSNQGNEDIDASCVKLQSMALGRED